MIDGRPLNRSLAFDETVVSIQKMPDRRPIALVAEQRLLGWKPARLKRPHRGPAGSRAHTEPAIHLGFGDEQADLGLRSAIVLRPARIWVFVDRLLIIDHGAALPDRGARFSEKRDIFRPPLKFCRVLISNPTAYSAHATLR